MDKHLFQPPKPNKGAAGIAIRYGLDGPGIESRCGRERFSAPVHIGPEAHPTSCTMGAGSFPGVKQPERGVDHPPPITPVANGFHFRSVPEQAFRGVKYDMFMIYDISINCN